MSGKATVDVLISEIERELAEYRAKYEGLSWREKVLLLVEVTASVKEMGVKTNPRAANVGARERIRLYLQENVGVVVAARELEVVSGISEYGRRVLRRDAGIWLTGLGGNRQAGAEGDCFGIF
jgi:hypothetical protein